MYEINSNQDPLNMTAFQWLQRALDEGIVLRAEFTTNSETALIKVDRDPQGNIKIMKYNRLTWDRVKAVSGILNAKFSINSSITFGPKDYVVLDNGQIAYVTRYDKPGFIEVLMKGSPNSELVATASVKKIASDGDIRDYTIHQLFIKGKRELYQYKIQDLVLYNGQYLEVQEVQMKSHTELPMYFVGSDNANPKYEQSMLRLSRIEEWISATNVAPAVFKESRLEIL
ncbi:hypothetical protein HSE3_gp007 [Bacillus phage vB_BceM-HSE3]|nr:hypothetical protein HSE3_gp007 [Bacillus phage vB_BceM-HSE3]